MYSELLCSNDCRKAALINKRRKVVKGGTEEEKIGTRPNIEIAHAFLVPVRLVRKELEIFSAI